MAAYLSKLFHEVKAEEIVVEPPYHMLFIAALRYYLHTSHNCLALTEEESRATRLLCESCASIVHLGM
jgi:hypothetical protein